MAAGRARGVDGRRTTGGFSSGSVMSIFRPLVASARAGPAAFISGRYFLTMYFAKPPRPAKRISEKNGPRQRHSKGVAADKTKEQGKKKGAGELGIRPSFHIPS